MSQDLHAAILRFCRRAIAVEFEVIEHNEPLIDLVFSWSNGFRCYLDGGDSTALIRRLRKLGHPAARVYSVPEFAAKCRSYGVPLVVEYRAIAEAEEKRMRSGGGKS